MLMLEFQGNFLSYKANSLVDVGFHRNALDPKLLHLTSETIDKIAGCRFRHAVRHSRGNSVMTCNAILYPANCLSNAVRCRRKCSLLQQGTHEAIMNYFHIVQNSGSWKTSKSELDDTRNVSLLCEHWFQRIVDILFEPLTGLYPTEKSCR